MSPSLGPTVLRPAEAQIHLNVPEIATPKAILQKPAELLLLTYDYVIIGYLKWISH